MIILMLGAAAQSQEKIGKGTILPRSTVRFDSYQNGSNDRTIKSMSISPGFVYYFSELWGLGLESAFNYLEDNVIIRYGSFTPLIALNKNLKDLSLFLETGPSYSFYRDDHDWGLNAAIGARFFVNDHVVIISQYRYTSKIWGGEYKNGNSLSIGFGYLIHSDDLKHK